jgi:lipid A 4'-phosphatase
MNWTGTALQGVCLWLGLAVSMLSRGWQRVACLALLGVLGFGLWPDLDQAVSALFYDPLLGFAVDRWTAVLWLHRLVPVLGWGLLLGALAMLASARWCPACIGWSTCRDASALAFAMLVGVGLVVNAGLKDHIGRPRPAVVKAFGGTLGFVPAMSLAGTCRRNCSFVSGHAATGFALIAVGSLAAAGWSSGWWQVSGSGSCGWPRADIS